MGYETKQVAALGQQGLVGQGLTEKARTQSSKGCASNAHGRPHPQQEPHEFIRGSSQGCESGG